MNSQFGPRGHRLCDHPLCRYEKSCLNDYNQDSCSIKLLGKTYVQFGSFCGHQRILKMAWGRAQWLTPVILAIWEAEIRKISVWEPAQANSSWDPISTNGWAWWCMPVVTSYAGGWDQEDHSSRPAQAKQFAKLHLNRKKLGFVPHVCHPSNRGKLSIEWWSWLTCTKIQTLSPK
jgi:hypothetical protein